jgi:uncharacterized membrane protein
MTVSFQTFLINILVILLFNLIQCTGLIIDRLFSYMLFNRFVIIILNGLPADPRRLELK